MLLGKISTLPVHIVGIGSALDTDQIGWLAVHQLEIAGFKERYPANRLELNICESPALLAAQFSSGYSSGHALIFLDAYYSNDPAGMVRHFSVEDLDTVARPASGHGFDLKQALALIASLEKKEMPVSIIGICAGTGIGTGADNPSQQSAHEILEKSLPALLDTIEKDVRRLMPTSLEPENNM